MQEMQVWFLGQEDPLQEEMATRSNILAWKAPWAEKPGGYSPWDHKELDTTAQLEDNGRTYPGTETFLFMVTDHAA